MNVTADTDDRERNENEEPTKAKKPFYQFCFLFGVGQAILMLIAMSEVRDEMNSCVR